MWSKWSRISFSPVSIDLLEVIYHNRESLYFICLMDMLGVNKFYVNGNVVLLQQFCFSIGSQQQSQRIYITRVVFFSANFWKKMWSILPAMISAESLSRSSSHVAFKNKNQTFFLASKLLNTLARPNFMHFNLKDIKHTLFPELQSPKASVLLVSCFSFDFLHSLRLILKFLNSKYIRCTFLVRLQPLKQRCCISLSILTFKNISATFLVVSLSRTTLILRFSCF